MSIHTTRANLLAQPVKIVLERYNDLATDLGRPTLKTWKAPVAGLVERVLKLMQEAGDRVEQEAAAAEVAAPAPQAKTPHPAIKSVTSTDHKTTRITAEKPAPKASPKAKQKERLAAAGEKRRADRADKSTFTLADLARDLKINPKVARAKARRHKLKPDADGWTFKAARRDEVTSILKGAK